MCAEKIQKEVRDSYVRERNLTESKQ